jgi:hypothetical protein
VEDHAVLLELSRRGANVRGERADVSSLEMVTLLFCCQADWPPIVGVVHCADALGDAHNTTMDKVFAPKALGAWNMHLATQHMDLDFFVVSDIVGEINKAVGKPTFFEVIPSGKQSPSKGSKVFDDNRNNSHACQ